eukprot:SAG11_NODE_686_length_7720_cov_1.748327_8_plen_133_part_00
MSLSRDADTYACRGKGAKRPAAIGCNKLALEFQKANFVIARGKTAHRKRPKLKAASNTKEDEWIQEEHDKGGGGGEHRDIMQEHFGWSPMPIGEVIKCSTGNHNVLKPTGNLQHKEVEGQGQFVQSRRLQHR